MRIVSVSPAPDDKALRAATIARAQPPPLLSMTEGVLLLLAMACTQPQPASPPAEEPKRGGVLSLLMSQTGEPPSFDLHQESVAAAMEVGGGAYENLITFNPMDPHRIVPDLAEGWELSADGMRYTFRVREGTRFHNGSPFTASDAKFTLERMKEPPAGMVSPRKPALDAVSSIEAPDAKTLVLQLKRRNPSLLPNLAQGWMAMYDREWVEARGQEAPRHELMGTGPFRFREHLRGARFELERNPDYRMPGRPYLDGLKYLVVPDFSTRVAAFKTGQAMISRLFPRDGKQLEAEMGDRIAFSSQVAPSFGALMLNSRRAPFDDARVREAVNLAVDRYAGVELLAQGDGEIGGYLMPGGAWGLPGDEILRLPGYSKEKGPEREGARRLLAAAGAPSEVQVLTRSGQTFETLAVFVADQLRQVGLNATIRPVETGHAFELARSGEFQALTWGHEFPLDDPDAVYGEFYLCNGPRNWSFLCVPEVESLFERQSQELDADKRRTLVHEMERRALASGTKVITHWNKRFDGVWRYVRGYVQHPSPFNNARYRDVWLDR